MQRLKLLAQILVVVAAVLVVYAVVTDTDGTFDPTADVATMRERLVSRVGGAAKDSRRAAKKTKKVVKKQERKLKGKANTVKRKVHKEYKRGMDKVP